MISRRTFVKAAGASVAALAVNPKSIIASTAAGNKNIKGAGDRVNVAFIGIGQKGEEEVKYATSTGLCNVLALCDVNMGHPWTQEVMAMFPNAKRYTDFRKLFDEMAGKLDAVFVCVPDFAHFPIAMRALKEGLHVYCEKPLCRTFHECQLLLEESRLHPELVTQLGNQGHSGPAYYQFKSWTEAGIIKNITRIDAFMNNWRRWHPYDTNIKKFPDSRPLTDTVAAPLALKVGDNITTDHIMPAGAKILPYRSNIPYLSQFCFGVCDKTFPERAKAAGESIVVGGSNYGQGSSREHAALVPLYLGVRAVVAKSFARIHAANLINAGILPLTFKNPADYDRLNQGDALRLTDVFAGMDAGEITLTDETTGERFALCCAFTERQKAILKAGGLLPYTKEENT